MEKAWKYAIVMVMTMTQYSCKGYTEGCEQQIGELFKLAFKRKLSLDDWNWRFLDNPCKPLCITTLWDGEKLIAHNALTPVNAYKYGERILSANSGTVMSNPEYLGVSLQLFTDCKRMYSCMDLIYGFPNKNSYRIATKYLHHSVVGEMCFWSKEISATGDLNSGIQEIKLFTEEHGCLYRVLIDKVDYVAERNTSFLNWRFIDKPHSGYKCFELVEDNRVNGYIVLNTYIDGCQLQGQIIDIVAREAEHYKRLINFANVYFADANCEIVKAWASFHELAAVFKEQGFTYGMHPFPMTVWDGSLRLDDSYITMADSDVF